MEACGFRDLHAEIRRNGAEVFGVSADPPEKLARWAQKQEFAYLLLGDEELETLRRWGVYGPKSFLGRKYEGIHRSTFLVGPDGRIAKAWPKASPIGHAKDVLEAVKALKRAAKPSGGGGAG